MLNGTFYLCAFYSCVCYFQCYLAYMYDIYLSVTLSNYGLDCHVAGMYFGLHYKYVCRAQVVKVMSCVCLQRWSVGVVDKDAAEENGFSGWQHVTNDWQPRGAGGQ